jgi:hypothetical protein
MVDFEKLPTDLQRITMFLKTLGWIPNEPYYLNGTFYANFEKIKSQKMHIEFDDYWEEK